MHKRVKRVGTDIAGYSLILLGLATGWLPGPGGIPLILAGLGLLSIHNTWAKHIKVFFLERGSEYMSYVFPADKRAQGAHDVLAATLFCVGMITFFVASAAWQFGLAVSCIALSVVDFLYNRDRIAWFRKKR